MLLSAPRASQSAATAGRGREGGPTAPRARSWRPSRPRDSAQAWARPAGARRARATTTSNKHPLPLIDLVLTSSSILSASPHRSNSHSLPHPILTPTSIHFSPPTSIQSTPHLHPLLSPHRSTSHLPPPSNSHLILHPILTSSSIQSTPHLHPLLTPHPSTSHPLKFPFLNLNNLQTNAPPGRAESRSLENRRNPGVLGRRNTCRPSREKRHGGGVALC